MAKKNFLILITAIISKTFFLNASSKPEFLPQSYLGKKIISSFEEAGTLEEITIPYGEEEVAFSLSREEPRVLIIHKIPKESHIVSLDGNLDTRNQKAFDVWVTDSEVLGKDPRLFAIRLPGGRILCPYSLPKVLQWKSYPRADKPNRYIIVGWTSQDSGFILFKKGNKIPFVKETFEVKMTCLNGSIKSRVEITTETSDHFVGEWLNKTGGYKKAS